MFDIKVFNDRDARFYYFMLRKLESGMHNTELVKEVKQAVRAWSHRPERIGRTFDESIDGYIAVYPLPERIESFDAAEEFFEENERMTYRPSAYDCTGQLFTAWHKTFKKDGRFWVYHRVSRDI